MSIGKIFIRQGSYTNSYAKMGLWLTPDMLKHGPAGGSSGSSNDFLPASLVTTWDPGIPGGIPNATITHSTIDAGVYGNNTVDATTAINNAITAAGAVATTSSLRVVYLPSGTYMVTAPIYLNANGVVLRGAGPNQTRIVMSGTTSHVPPSPPCIRVGYRFNYGSAINVTVDAHKGDTTITVANASTFNVGDVIQIDQQDGPAVSTGEGHFWNGHLWFGDGRYSKRQAFGDINGPARDGLDWVATGSWIETTNYNAQNTGPWRSMTQQNEITAKNGNTLTFRDPFHMDFTVARAAQVFKTISMNQADALGTRYCGVEGIAFAGGWNDNIDMVNAAYCWFKNIESDGEYVPGDLSHPGMQGRSIQLLHAYRCVVRDSYVHHAYSIVNGGGAYGIAVEGGSSANLVENNICVWLNKPIVMNNSGGGNVVAYNYADNAMIAGNSWQENAIDGCHQVFSHHDLFEGNMAPNIGADTTHGTSGWHLYFRNYAFGQNSMPYDMGVDGFGLPWKNLRAAGSDALNNEQTFAANVLVAVDAGRGAYYEGNPTYHPYLGSFVFQLGAGSMFGTNGDWDTGQALSSTFRHGNWDNISNAVVWDSGTSSRAVPLSYYLSSKPAFFGANTWPWVDPTGSTRLYSLPAKVRYDAGTPNVIA